MRLVLMSLAASLAVAAPAMAQSTAQDNGVRVDVHGGLGWHDGQAVQGAIGATLGYDIKAGQNAFVGVEQSIDKQLTQADRIRWTTAGRIGTYLTPNNKAYALAGYAFGEGPNGFVAGGGVEHTYGQYFTKVEYRHTFDTNNAQQSNAAVVGLGLRF